MTRKGAWGIQDVRDKHLDGLWDPKCELFSWGIMSSGRSGIPELGLVVSHSSPTQVAGSNWNLEQPLGGHNAYFSLGVKKDGTLWAWGHAEAGCLGQGDLQGASSPIQIGSETDWPTKDVKSKIYYDYYSAFVIKKDGTLWSWGYNDWGQLGHNNRTEYSSPTQVGSDTDWDIIHGSAAIKKDNTLWTWGWNYTGELGHNNRTEYSSPVQVPGNWLAVAAPIACGAMLAVRNKNDGASGPYRHGEGSLWSWGENNSGRLGHNWAGSPRSSPVQVGASTGGGLDSNDWKGTQGSICINDHCGFAIRNDGILWAWGDNQWGQLGLTDSTSYGTGGPNVGSQVDFHRRWKTIHSNQNDTVVGLKEDGTVWTWGRNNNGQLGHNQTFSMNNPTTPSRRLRALSSPTQLGMGNNWTSLTAARETIFGTRYDLPATKKDILD